MYEEDVAAYNEGMRGICSTVMGVRRDDVISVTTDFGPDGAKPDAARRRLQSR